MFSLEGYQAVRDRAGIVRRGDRGVLSVTGSDRLTWLQGLLTNDVAALQTGGVCDAAYLTPQGRMITDLRVVHLDDRTLLDVPASLAAGLRDRLDSLLFSEDAQVADISATTALVDVHGPLSREVVEHARAAIGGGAAIVFDDAFDVPGVSLFVDAAKADSVIANLTAAGAVAITLETLDVVRVEAGRPAFLIDMDEQTIPLEAGLERRAISFTKGCYVGQEVIVRVMHRGQGRVAKKLVGLTLASSELPKRGDTIAADGRDVGRVTSAVWSPRLSQSIALGYVHRDFVEPGTTVTIATRAGQLSARVSPLPFAKV